MDNSSESSSEEPWLDEELIDHDAGQEASIDIGDATVNESEHVFHKSYQRSVEQMMIYFKHYQTIMKHIAALNNCKVLFGTETLTIHGKSEEDVNRCYGELVDSLPSKGNFLRIQLSRLADMRIYMTSPWRLSLLAANNCHITAYLKNIIYLDSVQLSASELEEIKKKISPATTFAVCFRDCRNASAYDQHLAEYITNVIEHHSHKWKDFSAKAEMSTRGDAVFITAPDQKTRFALKNSCKKFIQQMMPLVVKPKPDAKTLKAYMKKVVDYPFVVEPVNNTLLIVTKDHIMNKLFGKDKFVANVIGIKNKIGMFLMKQKNDISKQDLIKKIADELDFSIVKEDNIMYFVGDITMESKQKKEQQNHFANFMQKFISQMMETSEKFTLTVDLLRQQKKKFEQESQPQLITKFYQEGDFLSNKDTLSLRQKFGCDLRMMKLHLNHKYLSRYNDMDGQEEKDVLFNYAEWCEEGKVGRVQIEFQKMRGKYFYGKVKKGSGKTMYKPEYLITVLL